MTRYTLVVVVFCMAIAVFGQSSNSTAPAKPCAESQQKQFDFWIGEWDLTWPGTNAGEVDHGTNTIQRVMDGCVVQESFSGGDSMHLRGMSVSTYVPQSNAWKQTWVDNEGGY